MANTAKTPQENRKSQKHRKKTASSYNVNDNANKEGKENGDGDIAPPFGGLLALHMRRHTPPPPPQRGMEWLLIIRKK